MTMGGGLVITDPARHIDGNLDVNTDQPCNSCHGGTNNAPPNDTAGNTATTARGVGAHQQHIATTGRFKPVDCTDCHKVPATVTAVGHIDTALPAELRFSTRAGTSTAWNGSRCSNNYCHGATMGAGGTATAPLWTTVNGSQATCQSCHGNPPPAPHPPNANCQDCHDDMSSPTMFSDPLRHIDGNVDGGSTAACNSCHGGTNNAPPQDTTGASGTTARGVGAHQAHVAGDTSWHKATTCAQCHTVPATVDAAGHRDTALPAELMFTGLAAGSTWNGSTCTSYCHGSTLGAGGATTAPQWTKVDGTQSQCSSCHGNPPPSHAGYASPTQCSNCHADGGTGGTFTNAAQHIDGTLQVNAQHPPGYNAREQHGYDFDQHGASTCATAACHGTALTGGSSGGPSCNTCHAPSTWRTTCNFCHGSTTNTNGAPPEGVMGQTAASDAHVGAHTVHLGATSMHSAWTCSMCHTTPTDALNANHIDGTGGIVQAEVVYSTMNPGATFTASTSGCASVYCHGSGLPSGGVAGAGTATWTSTTALNCTTSCHGGDAARTGMSSEHRRSDHRKTCNRCHNTVTDAAMAIINPSLHVNGTRNVSFSAGGTYNPSAKSCTGTGTGCHGSGTQSGWH
jgi:predicted CxxxxCH...CXXCH cytochrome family protein